MIANVVPQRSHLLLALAGILVAGALATAGAAFLGAGALGLLPTGPQAPLVVAPSASPDAEPTPRLTLMAGVGTSGDCLACHIDEDGGVGTRPIPALAHPLEGWKTCSQCHAQDRLVQTAPGHDGIHAQDCLVCHTETSTAAPDRPHSGPATAECLSCHGTTAPLSSSMAHRSVTNCWLCHQASKVKAPTMLHPMPSGAACRTCHIADKVGVLPTDHVNRADSTCTACHEAPAVGAPVAPHALSTRKDLCIFCHAEANPTQR